MLATSTPTRFSRSAALVQALALLAIGITGIALFLQNTSRVEGDAAIAVSGTAAIVFSIWSLVLAYRAIMNREQSRWPWPIFYLALFEISIPCLALWAQVYKPRPVPTLDLLVWLGLPVFGPFLAFGSAIAIPLAVWRARNSIEPKARWTFVKWYVGIVAVLGVFALPAPLYFLGAIGPQFYADYRELRPWRQMEATGWASKWAEQAPNFIRDGVESLLVRLDPDDWNIHYCIYVRGNISPERLISRFGNNRHNFDQILWWGLIDTYPNQAVEVAARILSDEVRVFNPRIVRSAAELVLEKGNTEQWRMLLASKKHKSSVESEQLALIWKIEFDPRASEFLPELEKLQNSLLFPERVRVLRVIARRTSLTQTLQRLNDDDYSSRLVAAIALALNRQELNSAEFQNPSNLEESKLTRKLMAMLNSADSDLCLAAMCVLGHLFRDDGGVSQHDRTASMLVYAIRPSIITPHEREEIEEVRFAVKMWFEDHNLPLAEP